MSSVGEGAQGLNSGRTSYSRCRRERESRSRRGGSREESERAKDLRSTTSVASTSKSVLLQKSSLLDPSPSLPRVLYPLTLLIVGPFARASSRSSLLLPPPTSYSTPTREQTMAPRSTIPFPILAPEVLVAESATTVFAVSLEDLRAPTPPKIQTIYEAWMIRHLGINIQDCLRAAEQQMDHMEDAVRPSFSRASV